MIHESILGTIGNTPVVRINRLAPQGVTIYVKCEAFNPLSSVKDRLAIAIIEDAERSGALKPGQTVIEATSGNTGIALAMVCAAKGYPFVAVMSDSFSIERRKLMRILGAKVVLHPAAERGSGMVRKTEEIAKKNGWFLARQFENPANPEYHRNTTGPEILRDFAGKRLDYWVTGYGTGGTLTGAGQVLKVARPAIKIVVAEPEGAALLSGQEWKPHKIQGWTPDFVPAVLDREVYDEVVTVGDIEARDAARDLATKEGIFCGISSGGTFAAAKKVAAKAPKGSVLLAMLPDTGERYLSTILFEGINEGTDEVPGGLVDAADVVERPGIAVVLRDLDVSVGIDRERRLRVDRAVARAEVRPVPREDRERIVERRSPVFVGFVVLDRARRHDEVSPAVLDLFGHDEIDRVDQSAELDLALTAPPDRVGESILAAVLEDLLQRDDLLEAPRARHHDVEGHAPRARGRADRRRRRVLARRLSSPDVREPEESAERDAFS